MAKKTGIEPSGDLHPGPGAGASVVELVAFLRRCERRPEAGSDAEVAGIGRAWEATVQQLAHTPSSGLEEVLLKAEALTLDAVSGLGAAGEDLAASLYDELQAAIRERWRGADRARH